MFTSQKGELVSYFKDVCSNACKSECEVSTIWFQPKLE